ncbi:MAG: Gfo/Idh/MocA family oxidoreductase [Pirellulales bacterium]|nr:Gfo/Idh/MocA family oxidoreductase [Pirellulales bacterium]
MSENNKKGSSRREFLKSSGRIAAASAIVGAAIPHVHAAENNTIQIALIGCGGRGTGAAANALSVNRGPVKLVAMADAFKDRLDNSYGSLKKQFPDKVDVPDDRKCVGIDAYKKAMDSLKPGDIAIFATPLAFRWVHFDYAVNKGLNVFMEKPLTADGPTSRRMLDIADKSVKKNLKVGVGLMSRHARPLQQLAERIHGGEIGDLVMLRGYRMHGPIVGYYPAKPAGMNEVEYQLRKFHAFIWASGGTFSDFYIHIIDHCCWMKNAWPVKAMGLGGRHYRGNCVDQNFDVYSVEYTYPDGSKFVMDGRSILGCENVYHSFAHGTKGCAVVSKSGDCSPPSTTYKGQSPDKANQIWRSKKIPGQENPYQNEWNDLVDAIRDDKPFNEARRGVEASLVTSMGRMAAHIGGSVTFDEMLKSDHEYAPGLDKLTFAGPAPLMPDANGAYPIPKPGIITKREY